ncbi:MAG: hypothetical protein IMW88_11135 [Thermoflavifilum sp.]|uniref:hypothetical protein n=1 Tax=Thermoflavifilum sp. TaxID=1968839 RepID=UPI0018A51346|nr:hypothetical protein [Thermoflavifilum sp.]QOR75852.1 MAG: hypothetical protein IMW88_11135 [Thermoflavifilum sp.]
MKTLSNQEMVNIVGGKTDPFWNGACAAVGALELVGSFLALTGVGAAVLIAGTVACEVYAIAHATD